MKQGPGHLEIESLPELIAHTQHAGSLDNVVVQGLDLTGSEIEQALLGLSAQGASLLGCTLSRELATSLTGAGAALFPAFDLGFQVYRNHLYTPDELMQGYVPGEPASLATTLDQRIFSLYDRYRSTGRPLPVMVALAYRIHDHAIDDALEELLRPEDLPPRRVVGVMGGHGMHRSAPEYAAVARLGRELTRAGYFVATGGGPGAMEAANLGAYLAAAPVTDLDAAIEVLSRHPTSTDPLFVEVAYEVLDRHPTGQESLAVPTWFYGHEPTNLFAAAVAKYFANSIREEGLVAIARHGVVFAPGSAGTIQEVFQDAAQNHYGTYGVISPMVFFGTTFWSQTKPVEPLVRTLAAGSAAAELLLLSDDVEEVVGFLAEHGPIAVR